MVTVLIAAPKCSDTLIGTYARVNDFLRYHQSRESSDVNINVAALSWCGEAKPTSDSLSINAGYGGTLHRVSEVLRTALANAPDADIIHLTNMPRGLSWLVPLLSIDGTPLLVGPNNTGNVFPEALLSDETIRIMEQEKKPTLQRWRRYGERLERAKFRTYEMMPGPTKFLAQSEFARSILTTRGVNPEQIRTLPSGVPTDVFNPEQEPITWPGAAVNGPKLLYVGRPDRRKGFHVFVDALAELSARGISPSAVLCGANEPPEFLNEHEGLAHVTFEGFVDRSNLPGYYRAADQFIIPSFYEAEPTVLIEALACGTPAVATDDRPFTEIGFSDTCCYAERGNPTALADAIEELYANQADYERCAQERAKGYNIASVYDLIVDTYTELAG